MSPKPDTGFDATFLTAFDQLLAWRRDVRTFDTRSVENAVVEDLLRLAQFAPSVGHAQPWRFIRVRTPALRERLAAHVDVEAERAAAEYDAPRRARYARLPLHGLRQAPEVIAVFTDEAPDAGHGLGRATMPETLRYSTVLAIHTLWLAAHARGLGLGWVSIVQPSVVNELLQAPGSWSLTSLLCLGHPVETNITPELERRGWESRRDWKRHIYER